MSERSEGLSNQPIVLGELIQLLAARDPEQEVRFDLGYIGPDLPGCLMSYRGYYEHLAIGYAVQNVESPKVGVLLQELRAAVGKMFEGYKGGDFIMGPHTPVWVSNYGESCSTAVVGISTDSDYQTVIETRYCEDWAGGQASAIRHLQSMGMLPLGMSL